MNHQYDPLKDRYDWQDLLALLRLLRSEQGCPWDREQTLASLQKYLLEESYESVSAFYSGEISALKEELGDVLLQVVFQSQIAAEAQFFDINDVISALCSKLVKRHSHLFSDDEATTAAEVKALWEENKAKEKKPRSSHLLEEAKAGLSPLQRAHRLQAEAAKVGFDWPDYEGPLVKVHEELIELAELIPANTSVRLDSSVSGANESKSNTEENTSRLLEEAGDLLFAVVNLLRKLKLEPETALASANAKFTRRFQAMEDLAVRKGQIFSRLNLEEQDALWDEIKMLESNAHGNALSSH